MRSSGDARRARLNANVRTHRQRARMNEFLGFAVLIGPLWLFLLVVPFAIWIAAVAGKRARRLTSRMSIGIAVFAFLIFLPLADEFSGRIYFAHLCDSEARVKVYQSVVLPA